MSPGRRGGSARAGDMLKIACDICGQDYSILPERMGDSLRCKICLCEFEVAQSNLVVDKDERALTFQEWWQSDSVFLFRRVFRAILLLGLMVWLTSLFFVDTPPRPDFRRSGLHSSESLAMEGVA
jgi:hypothetical protein